MTANTRSRALGALVAMVVLAVLPASAEGATGELPGEWSWSANAGFTISIDTSGVGTHTAGADGCFDGAPSQFWRGLTETTPGTFTGERLLGNACNVTWVATTLTLSVDGNTLTEHISTGPTITYVRANRALLGAWHDPVVVSFKVRFNADGTGDHVEGAGECWDTNPGIFWRNVLRTGPNTWHAERRLGNYCNDQWVTADLTLSPMGDRITEEISTGAIRYYVREAPTVIGDWHDPVVTSFKVRINDDGTGDHVAGAGECWDTNPGIFWRNIVQTAPDTWHAERRLGNACNDVWVTADLVLAADGQSFVEYISTSAVRYYVREGT